MAFGVAYTWSRTTSNTDSKRNVMPDAFDDSMMWGVANQHRKHILVASYVYDLPFLKSNKSWLGTVLGGWQVSGITDWRSGSPINTGDNTFGAGWRNWDNAGVGAGSGNQPYSLVGNPKLPSPQYSIGVAYDSNYFFDPKAFIAPAAGTFGNVGKNIILGPNAVNWDLSAVKKFRLGEAKYFQIRADFYNWPNHPNWNNPDGSPTSSTFGRITGKGGNRQVQMTATIRF